MKQINYVGQQFGTRLIISNECTAQDWTKLGVRPPNGNFHKYVLGKCLNCGAVIPSQLMMLKRQPPKRCTMCSNIGNHLQFETDRNTWAKYDKYAVCNVTFHSQVVSFIIDADMFDIVSAYTWRISQKRNKFYVVTGSAKKNTMIYLHTLIIGQPKDGFEIDHIDGNSLNNRKNNLRFVTHTENTDNIRAARIDNQIGIRGIAFDKKSRKYTVDFSWRKQRVYCKPWNTIEEAVYCRRMLEKHYGKTMVEDNPIADYYNDLSDEKKKFIEEYVQTKILGNER